MTKISSIMLRFFSLASAALLIFWALVDDYLIGGGPGFGVMQLAVLILGLALLLASFAPQKVTSSIFTIFLSTAVTFALVEYVLRALYGHKYYTPFQADERYHYKLIPNSSREYRHLPINGGEKIIYRVNSQGFRGNELLEPAAPKRIVVYGDSFIQAEFSSLENTFAYQLALKLKSQLGENIEVINAGIAGYGPDQILKKIQDEILMLQPDVVVLSIFAGNDFGDLIRNKMYRIDKAGMLQENDFQLSNEFQRNITLSHKELVLKKLSAEVASIILGDRNPSELASLTPQQRVEQYYQQHIKEFKDYILDGNNIVSQLLSDPYSADISLTPGSESATYKVQLMNAVVGKNKTVVDSKKSQLVGLIIPHPMDLLEGRHDSGEVNRQVYSEYNPKYLTDTLQNIMTQHNIPHVNLYEFFRRQDPISLYFKGGDDHWNDQGQKLAAEIFSEYLIAEQLISDDL